ncbi:sulfurtransferase [Hydrogenophaga laconesensis]|uniref:Sulfurtransferase n=1 Tax=Hydrogenophaga laconesensis TaxID=1805971 RepID=A0ABU1VBM6_9BURK|nr:sulfurtransferase [Hydrogenophaga laconesensis]MDR7094886.1 thiosulfate/3-mercaptopyruvate sulfurtransferase [Hydrogenophaga laconesensis]
MTFNALISVDELAAAQAAGQPLLVLDCSFELTDPGAGQRVYDAGHIPGARYVNLDRTLSAEKTGRNGRHPLPSREAFAAAMAAMGLDEGTQVVAYDNANGMYAARLWWMLRWVGHHPVAVLDGGMAAWTAAGHALSTDAPATAVQGGFRLQPSLVSTVSYEEVKANIDLRQRQVLDARAPDRFRGENETLDPIGGHIPGARNRLFKDNLRADGRFKSAAQLRQEFDAITGGLPAEKLINQCGSGVTACHNLLAMEVAGLHGAALYPGSWSEWSAQPGAPIATGAN